MKNVITNLFLAILTIGSINAQEKTEKEDVQTVFKKNSALGAYFGLIAKPTALYGQEGLLFGAELNLVFGHQLNVGVVGMGLVSDIKSGLVSNSGYNLYYEFGYGGIKMEPVLFSNKLVHLTIPVILGAGAATLNPRTAILYDGNWDYEYNLYDSDFFFVAEPGINVEVNLYKNLRLDFGTSYRFVDNVFISGTNNGNFGGLSGNIGIKLGWF